MCDPLAACGDVHRAAVVLVDAFPWAAQSGSQRQEAFVTIEEIGFVSPIGVSGRLNLFAALALGSFA